MAARTWYPDQLIAPVNVWQADPQVQVADDGTVFAVWLDGPYWMSKLVKSYDHGATWTEPVVIAPSLRWTDHPWLLVSPDGQDVYVGLNKDDSYIVARTMAGRPLKCRSGRTPRRRPATGGMQMVRRSLPTALIYYVVINFFLNYKGPAEINVVSSHDHGASWQTTLVDTSRRRPAAAVRRVATTDFFPLLRGWRSTRVEKSSVVVSGGRRYERAATNVDYDLGRRDQLDATGAGLPA